MKKKPGEYLRQRRNGDQAKDGSSKVDRSVKERGEGGREWGGTRNPCNIGIKINGNGNPITENTLKKLIPHLGRRKNEASKERPKGREGKIEHPLLGESSEDRRKGGAKDLL